MLILLLNELNDGELWNIFRVLATNFDIAFELLLELLICVFRKMLRLLFWPVVQVDAIRLGLPKIEGEVSAYQFLALVRDGYLRRLLL